MKKTINYLEVNLELPTNFADTLYDAIDDEIEVASGKWNVFLNTEDKQLVRTKSIEQLLRKVYKVSKNKWELEDKFLKVSIVINRNESFELTLPDPHVSEYNLVLTKSHDEWIISDEPTDKSIAIAKFYDYFLDEVVKWLRTAVFYGVGSFS